MLYILLCAVRVRIHSRLDSIEADPSVPIAGSALGLVVALQLTVEESEYALLRVEAQQAKRSCAFSLLHREHVVQGSVYVVKRALVISKG